MNYFPFHIGDYAAHTAHLEPMEDLAYRRLIELYYLREGPLLADIQATAKLIRMRSMLADVESVLREFFTLTEEGWFHSRCDAELNAMLHRQQMAKDKANKRWHQPEKVRGNATASENDATAYAAASKKDAEAMLPTPVPTPVPKERKTVAPPDGVADAVWQDFKKLRTAKRAPITETALAGIRREAEKAGYSLEQALQTCCKRGWTGFEAAWVLDKADIARQTVPSIAGPDPELIRLKNQAAQAAPMPAEIRARIAEVTRRVA